MGRRARGTWAAVMAAVLVATATGCGNDSEESGPLQFWSTMIEPERVEIQRELLARFTEETGVEAEFVPIAEDELDSLMVAGAASGELPDVVYHPIDYAHGWAEQGVLDTEAAAQVVEELGADTFNERALELATVDGGPVSVPTDGWGQLLVYRTDLFEQAGLEPPTTYENMLAAAEALHDPAAGMNGFTAATDPAEVFTQQTFEHFALAGGCRMVDDEGAVALGSPECARAIETYSTLIRDYSPGSVQNVDSTRATYFAGQAAMLIWSPFILDEMAGLRADAMPTCPECAANPRFLAENSGLVPAFSADGGDGAQYGQVSYFGIGADADVEGAKTLVSFLLGDGYADWLAIAPEGQIPMRAGTAEDPQAFTDAWRELQIGVDSKAPITEVYSEDIVDTLVTGSEQFDRWGLEDGYGTLVSSVYQSLVVPQTLNQVLNGDLSPQDAAARLESEVSEELDAVGGGG
jgi:multiple sugar transport system substrate-binding protein